MSWLFAPIYDRIMAPTEEACLRAWRSDLLARASGRVLEVGAGTGATLDLYPPSLQSVTFLEPDAGMRRQLEEKLSAATPPWTHDVVDAPGESLPFADDTFDTVVAMLVLCTVHDPARSICEIHRVLKPTGRLIFMEHVGATPGSSRRFWQGFSEPVWKRVAGGCHLTRDTEAYLEKHFDLEVTHESMRKSIGIVRPTIRGTGTPN